MSSRSPIAAALTAAVLLAASATPAPAEVALTYATDWKAQAEHGGLYQAVATGLYAKYGLNVTIRMGGPGSNISQLLATGAVDAGTGSSSFSALSLAQAGAPVRAVMAMFQKDPQVLMAHPGQGITSIADMRGRPILIGPASINTFWVWLAQRYGFTEDMIRPYTFNMAPWLTDRTAIQQGYLSSEPFQARTQGGVEPAVFLLADEGYPAYASLAMMPDAVIAASPELVQGFVNATIEGWYSYLFGDPSPGNALILADNPEMSPELIAYGISTMKEYGILDSGDAATLGIGAMTEERWRTFFEVTSANGVYPADLDWHQAFTTAFVNRGHGMEMRR